ncbi:MAG: glycosyltransferase family 4 protein [Cyclobacteriaceae bacterium]
MNILYLGDPNSFHDLQWISYFSQSNSNRCYFLCLKHQLRCQSEQNLETIDVQLIGSITNFSISRFWVTLAEFRKIKNVLRKHDIDIIHVLFAEPNSLWAIGRGFLEKPFIVTTRGTDVLVTISRLFDNRSLVNSVVKRLYLHAFSKIDAITCTSTRQVNVVINKLESSVKPQVVRTGVDINAFQENTLHSVDEIGDQPYLLFPRNMKPIYNHEFSLEAISKLPNDYLRRFKFVFVNKDSSDKAYVAQIEAQMNHIGRDSFVFMNSVPQSLLFSLYEKAAIIVMTPISDGSPVTAMEAMYAGRPLILPPLNYDEDLFGQVPYKLTRWDTAELANCMVQLLSNPIDEKRMKLGKSCIEQKANRQIEMNKVHAIYTLLISQ